MDKEVIELAIANFQRKRIVGEIEVNLPEITAIETIANCDLPKEKQKFQYTEQPKRGVEPSEEFLNQEIQRIKNGYWFFNNGNLEYITGYHYTMCNYSVIDGVRPLFTDSQRDFFYVWDAVEKDPFCFGLCLTTSRRWGKGEVAIIIGYLRTILKEHAHFGFQSKTGDDAKLLFSKLVQRWKRFPVFLKPTDAGDTNPKQELRFFEPSRRSSSGVVKQYQPALDSWIDFKPSTNAAYDGDKLHTYVLDEAAKAEKSDPYDTWEIVKFCLLNGSTIYGKALITTTVESGDNFESSISYKQMWDDSNPNQRLPNGRTKTGLYRYYNPGYMGLYGCDEQTGEAFIDEYGYSKVEVAKDYILKGREGLEGNQLSGQIRKLSLTVQEAFMSDGQNCYFNSMNLQNQITWLQEYAPKNLIRRVTFYRNKEGKSAYRDDPNGKVQMIWDFPDPLTQANKFKYINRLKAPDNLLFGSTGGDPYAASEMQNGVGSKGVFYVYKKDDGTIDSGMPILRYCDRPPRKSIFYDQCMLIAEYFGIKVCLESDIQDWREYYEQQGQENYIMRTPKSAIAPDRQLKKRLYGVKSKDPYSLQAQFDAMHVYIEERCERIYFIELLQDALVYDHHNRTKSDDSVAFMISLLGSTEHVKNVKEPSKLQILNVVRRSA